MMTQPDISFILTCYNLERYVGAAITSLLAQEGNYSFELIVIDDCSTDGSVAIIEQFTDERIHLVRHAQNQGAAASINEAFALARGRYIGRFDADDVWLPHFLNTCVPLLEQHPHVGLVYGDISIINASGEITDSYCTVPDYTGWASVHLLKALLADYLICAPAILARREAWALALPLPTYLLFCDFEMALHIAQHWKLLHVPQVLAQYRLHAQNMHATSIRHKRAESSIFDTMRRFREQYPSALTAVDWDEIAQKRYLHLGDQYFGTGEMLEARRCYRLGRAYRQWRSNPGYLRRYWATFLPAGWYPALKKMLKGA